MKATGIIAEYNPFHNGHAYQLTLARKETGADYIVIAMSGDFLQRGTPAITDKYIRTQMALSAGADLVLEIPALQAVSSAEYFARAGIQCLAATSVVDSICYGCESVRPELLSALTEALTESGLPCQTQNSGSSHAGQTQNTVSGHAGQTQNTDSDHLGQTQNTDLDHTRWIQNIDSDYAGQAQSARQNSIYRAKLTELLRSGASYPLARQEALCTALPELDAADIRSFLSSPNNILALEYEKAIAGWNAEHPHTVHGHAIQRTGDGYHSSEISSRYASATALRSRILSAAAAESAFAVSSSSTPAAGLWEALSDYMPPDSLNLLRSAAGRRQLMDTDDFSDALYASLLSCRRQGYTHFADVSEALSRRIDRRLNEFVSFTQFAGLLKTKEITHTRITRILTHIMLGFTGEDLNADVPYLRLLGFRRSAAPLLAEIRKKASVPLITKVADASLTLSNSVYHSAATGTDTGSPRIGSEPALRSLQRDIYAADLYRGICSIKSGLPMRNEYTQPVIILP